MEKFIIGVVLAFFGPIVIGLCLLLAGLMVAGVGEVTGNASYDYRCTNGIIESRYNLWDTPVGSWSPEQRDTVGIIDCDEWKSNEE